MAMAMVTVMAMEMAMVTAKVITIIMKLPRVTYNYNQFKQKEKLHCAISLFIMDCKATLRWMSLVN
ncbi:hypothetical protein LSP03_01280 [Lysinibacillus sphaericus]|nr:hypothetical protein LSP03_01280 [Lysinibacillus sphaericus]